MIHASLLESDHPQFCAAHPQSKLTQARRGVQHFSFTTTGWPDGSIAKVAAVYTWRPGPADQFMHNSQATPTHLLRAKVDSADQ